MACLNLAPKEDDHMEKANMNSPTQDGGEQDKELKETK